MKAIVLIVGLFLINLFGNGEEMNDSSKIDSNFRLKILESIESYHSSRQTITDWKIVKTEDGNIETDWYRDHKGEVVLKIKINPNVRPPEVLVLQKVSWFFFFSKEIIDSEWAKKTKQSITLLLSTRN